MESINHVNAFLITVLILYLFLGTYLLYYTNTFIMRKKSYKPEYINQLKKDIRKRVLGIAIALPIIILLAGGIVALVFGTFELENAKHIFFFSLFFIILVSPFPILEVSKSNKKNKELALKTDSEVVVDYNHVVLHLLFRPTWELLMSIIYVVFMMWLIRDFHPALFHVVIIWLLYASVRSARFLVAPALKDAYIYAFVFLSINHLLLIFYLVRETIFLQKASGLNLWIGMLIGIILLLKWFYYLFNLPEVKSRFAG